MKTLIIAEAGVNHNGSVELAKKMIDVAKDAGVDVIKYSVERDIPFGNTLNRMF